MKKESGMTLVELIMTLFLSSILFVILGYIIVSANTWWQTTNAKVLMEDDMRYARRRIEYLVRNAINNGADASLSAVGAGKKIHGVEIGNGQYLQFNGNDTLKLVKGQLIYYKSTPPTGQEVLLNNVTRAVFHSWDTDTDPGDEVSDGCVCSIELLSRKTLPGGQVIQSSATIMVPNMNSGL